MCFTGRAYSILMVGFLVMSFTVCGGGGSDPETMTSALEGLWVSDCTTIGDQSNRVIIGHSQVGSEKRYERVFDSFSQSDCQGEPDRSLQIGLYEVLDDKECVNGFSGKCVEIDYIPMDPPGFAPMYNVYSIDLSSAPYALLFGDSGNSSVQRPDDVETFGTYWRDEVENHKGRAVVDVYIQDGGGDSTPPAPLTGYAHLPIDLNESTGGNYIWLYYKTANAFGGSGVPLRDIYTVDVYDGETPQRGGLNAGYPGSVNLNAGTPFVHSPLWLYKVQGIGPVIRCVVVANEDSGQTEYGPPEAEGLYDIVWVEELIPDSHTTPYGSYPPYAQDLNEGESGGLFPLIYISDYIYIGYCIDKN